MRMQALVLNLSDADARNLDGLSWSLLVNGHSMDGEPGTNPGYLNWNVGSDELEDCGIFRMDAIVPDAQREGYCQSDVCGEIRQELRRDFPAPKPSAPPKRERTMADALCTMAPISHRLGGWGAVE